MVEKEVLREKEAEIRDETQHDVNNRILKQKNLQAKAGKKLIKAINIPFEVNKQGIVRYYTVEGFKDLTNDDWSIFCHEIRQHSGRHKHQGGILLFVIKGRGYTVVDGKRFDWSSGDLILLPIKKGGVEHQHFNLDGKPSRWVAFRNRPSSNIGNFKEQTETFSMWQEKERAKARNTV